MAKIYFTLTGTNHYYGSEFLQAGMTVMLEKEPDNEHDCEAIMVKAEGLGVIGYVANSPYMMQGESWSAGRMYDKIDDTALGQVIYKLPRGVLCKLLPEEDE